MLSGHSTVKFLSYHHSVFLCCCHTIVTFIKHIFQHPALTTTRILFNTSISNNLLHNGPWWIQLSTIVSKPGLKVLRARCHRQQASLEPNPTSRPSKWVAAATTTSAPPAEQPTTTDGAATTKRPPHPCQPTQLPITSLPSPLSWSRVATMSISPFSSCSSFA